MLYKTWSVIRREFVERVRTKAFIISTVLGPVFFGAMAIVPGYLMSRDTGVKRIAVVDASGNEFGQKLTTGLKTAKRRGEDAGARYEVTRVAAAGRLLDVRDSLVKMTGLSKRQDSGFEGLLLVSDSSVTSGKLQYPEPRN